MSLSVGNQVSGPVGQPLSISILLTLVARARDTTPRDEERIMRNVRRYLSRESRCALCAVRNDEFTISRVVVGGDGGGGGGERMGSASRENERGSCWCERVDNVGQGGKENTVIRARGYSREVVELSVARRRAQRVG